MSTPDTGQRYSQRGVSATKEDVHKAIAGLDKGLFPQAFCKVYPDIWGGDEAFCNIMHADGAGTKSILAYMYWKETGDLSVWEGIAIDSIVMNLDDMLCVGATGPFTYSSTIGRNKTLVPGEVISAIINGSQRFFEKLAGYGIDVHFMGGETADVGDVVRTVIVDGTMACRMLRDKMVTTEKMQAGDVVVSFASYGQATYEDAYNSGMGSNGLTSARHEMLDAAYGKNFPESLDPALPAEVVYNGSHHMQDAGADGQTIGQMLLSPTRTYAPLVLRALDAHRDAIHGIIHCSGGGQGKVLHYLPKPLRVIKNALPPPPPLFTMIQQAAGTPWKEMYQVFNMGTRLEMYTDHNTAESLIEIAAGLGIEAWVTGRVENSVRKEVLLETGQGSFTYEG